MSILLANSNSKRMPLADKVVQCAVLSPPYWQLRSYTGTASWSGGSSDCDHEAARKKTRFDYPLDEKQASNGGSDLRIYGDSCPDCGAVRIDHQLGSEPLHDCGAWAKGEPPCGACFVCNLREVFQELWRVLRDDGTVWLNLGDSYASTGGAHGGRSDNQSGVGAKSVHDNGAGDQNKRSAPTGLKPKDLCLIPARVALALQADGWYVRSEIIWAKKNPMPESVTDRPTKAHEQIYLLTKSERYFWDQEAVREAAEESTNERDKYKLIGYAKENRDGFINHLDPSSGEYRNCNGGRNLRTVWSLASESFSGAHYATFPTEIPRRCIKAGSPEAGSCSVCGAPWERVVERPYTGDGNPVPVEERIVKGSKMRLSGRELAKVHASQNRNCTGHRPTCTCNAPTVPATVLDPFAGSGTTLQVARELGRHGIGLDLSYHYLHDVARARLNLDKLDAWQNNTNKPELSADLSELPLFGSLKD